MKKQNNKNKAVNVSAGDKYAYTMKMVTSNTCFTCKSQCVKGIAYLEKMSQPGAIGKGIPCPLTKGKGFK